MGRVSLVVLVVIASACVPDEVPIGRTVWSRPAIVGGHVGPDGHFAFSPRLSSGAELVGLDGSVLWKQSFLGIATLDVAVGRGGSVVLASAKPEFKLSPIPVVHRFEGDGTLAWTSSFPDALVKDHVNTAIAIGADEGVWLVFDANTPSDLGGGAFGDTTHTIRWARFARDGSYRASGVFPFAAVDSIEIATAKDPTALPGGGLAMIVDGRLLAFDDSGQPLWSLEGPIERFVVYDDGSLSVGIDSHTIVRYDGQRNERWRVTGNAIRDHTGTADGGVIFVESDGLGNARDVSVVTRVDAEGEITREIIVAAQLSVLRGPPSSGYVMLCVDCGSVDVNDRTIDIPVSDGAYIKREL